jgi:signal recognition particle subunit SRP54
MFKTLTEGFRKARQKLTGVAELTEADIEAALRDVRLSLLEADVELNVTRRFLGRVKEKMLGQVVKLRAEAQGKKATITPDQLFVKACQDELVAMMSSPDGAQLTEAPKGTPTVVMMVGLQGQGKTTTSAKLAKLLTEEGKKVLLVAADLQRPAAVEQLNVLGQKVNVPVFSAPNSTPVEVCRRALAMAKVQKKDVVIFDTAGRLAIDTVLMDELRSIKSETKPHNILLVVNAAIGQNALATATAFHDTLGLTGVALTMLDGDARGGAALAIREVTGIPIRYAGVGESLDKLEAFRPDGMASRILGMGDIVSVVNDFKKVIDEKRAEEDAMRMLEGQFTLDDFVAQIETIQKMGPLQDLFDRMPFFSGMLPPDAKVDDRELDKAKVIVSSMTRGERRDAELFKREPGRVQRVAKGSGYAPEAVAELVAKFVMMRDMMGNIGQQASFLQKLPGAKQLAMARKLKDMVKVQGEDQAIAQIAQEMLESAVAGGGGRGGFPGMPGGFPGMPGGMGGFPGMGDPNALMQALMGGGMPGGPGQEPPKARPAGIGKPKDKRKQERDARRKNRKK